MLEYQKSVTPISQDREKRGRNFSIWKGVEGIYECRS